MVQLVIVELTNQSLQNSCNIVLALTKDFLNSRTQILFASIYKQLILLCNHHPDSHRQQMESFIGDEKARMRGDAPRRHNKSKAGITVVILNDLCSPKMNI